jgi:hypothetical protein
VPCVVIDVGYSAILVGGMVTVVEAFGVDVTEVAHEKPYASEE